VVHIAAIVMAQKPKARFMDDPGRFERVIDGGDYLLSWPDALTEGNSGSSVHFLGCGKDFLPLVAEFTRIPTSMGVGTLGEFRYDKVARICCRTLSGCHRGSAVARAFTALPFPTTCGAEVGELLLLGGTAAFFGSGAGTSAATRRMWPAGSLASAATGGEEG
jgi:hypothetical protein